MKNLISNMSTIRYPLMFMIILALTWAFFTGREAATAQGVPSRFAVVDTEKILLQSNIGKAALAKVKQLQDARTLTATQMDAEIKGLQTTLDTGRVSMTEQKKNELTKQIADKRIVLAQYVKDADAEVSVARDRALSEMDAKLMPSINAIGKEMGLAAVFRKFESGLIYADDAIDITNTIITRVNASTP